MKRGIAYGIVGLLIAIGLYVLLHRHDRKVDQQIASPTLGSDERLKYVIDQKLHTVTAVVLQPGSSKPVVTRTYLNPHGPVSITEKKDGTVTLAQRSFGTIHEPNIGAAFGADIKLRAALGLNLLYVRRWELGGGLLVNPTQIKDLRAYVSVSYNVYSNWLLSAGVDNHKAVQLIASVRF